MRQLLSLVAVAVMVSGVFAADGIKSGLKTGELVGPFYVTKSAGAEKDGVSVGQNLCYRCKNGGRPQVMVFTRSSDKKVVEFVTKLDKALAKNKKKQLRAFVNYLGESKSSATKAAKTLCKTAKVKMIPFVVPNEAENGPADYGINAKAEITILLAEGGKVKANHAVKSAKDLDVSKVIKDLSKILN